MTILPQASLSPLRPSLQLARRLLKLPLTIMITSRLGKSTVPGQLQGSFHSASNAPA